MNGHIHGEDALCLASPMYPAASFRGESEFDHVDHVFRGSSSLEYAEVCIGYVAYAPKLTTSKTFALPSSDTLANSSPSALAETPTMGDMCAR